MSLLRCRIGFLLLYLFAPLFQHLLQLLDRAFTDASALRHCGHDIEHTLILRDIRQHICCQTGDALLAGFEGVISPPIILTATDGHPNINIAFFDQIVQDHVDGIGIPIGLGDPLDRKSVV